MRPSRFYVTTDNVLVMASEVGVYDVPAEKVVLKSRLKPGRMLLVDTQEKKLIQDVELKASIAKQRPHSEWLQQKVSSCDNDNTVDPIPVILSPQLCPVVFTSKFHMHRLNIRLSLHFCILLKHK